MKARMTKSSEINYTELVVSYMTSASVYSLLRNGYQNQTALNLLQEMSSAFELLKAYKLVKITDFNVRNNFNYRTKLNCMNYIYPKVINYADSYVNIIIFSLMYYMDFNSSEVDNFVRVFDSEMSRLIKDPLYFKELRKKLEDDYSFTLNVRR